MDRELELQLVDRLREGDTEAFDAVYDAFNARLYNFLARLSNRHEVAEDLLEETWLRLVTHAGRLRADTRLGPWLFTVARNLYTSYCRSRMLEESHNSGLLGLWPHGRPARSPVEVAEAGESERQLATALASLPVMYREALLLIAVEGLRHAETADICGVSVQTMRQRVSRARALLASRLADAGTRGLAALKEITT
jgi:RNA polymerase sigma-70 factor, ECF subfamily